MSDELRQRIDERGLANLQFDLFQRFSTLARMLVAAFPPPANVRVLDVGCGPRGLTGEFLPDRFQIARADIDDHGQAGITRLQPGAPLPFADDSFDAAVAMDVLEHVAPGDRPLFIGELGRVAARLCVLAFPTAEAAAAEAEFQQMHVVAFGSANAFLSEHARHGLPDPADCKRLLAARLPLVAATPNCRLEHWLFYGVLDTIHAARFGDGPEKAAFNAVVNGEVASHYDDGEHYRVFLTATDDAALARRLAAAMTAARGHLDAGVRARTTSTLVQTLARLEAMARVHSTQMLDAKDAVIADQARLLLHFKQVLADKDLYLTGKVAHIEKLEALMRGQGAGGGTQP